MTNQKNFKNFAYPTAAELQGINPNLKIKPLGMKGDKTKMKQTLTDIAKKLALGLTIAGLSLSLTNDSYAKNHNKPTYAKYLHYDPSPINYPRHVIPIVRDLVEKVEKELKNDIGKNYRKLYGERFENILEEYEKHKPDMKEDPLPKKYRPKFPFKTNERRY